MILTMLLMLMEIERWVKASVENGFFFFFFNNKFFLIPVLHHAMTNNKTNANSLNAC
jgi:hypothetical protein